MSLLGGLGGDVVNVADSASGGLVDNIVNATSPLTDGLLADAVSVASSAQVQAILQMVTALQLAPFDWPPNASVKDGDTFDYIIVGCGTAGSIIANRLTEIHNTSVACMEAGGDPPLNSMLPLLLPILVKSKQDWNYYTEDDKFSSRCTKKNKVEWTSGKMLGGSSSLDHMFHLRGAAADFLSWAEAAADDSWGWDGLFKYFLKVEKCIDKDILNSEFRDLHGTHGYIKVAREPHKVAKSYLDAFKEIGNDVLLDIFTNTSLGFVQPMYAIADGFRQSHAYGYLTPIKERPNLHILKYSEVTKILFDDGKAVGVKVFSKSKSITLNARKEIIVTAGVLNTPKLLMLSGIGPKKHLKKFGIKVISDLPVGKNLQDHMSVTVVHKTKKAILPGASTLPSPFKFPAPLFYGFTALNKTQNFPDYVTVNGILRPESAAVVFFFCSIVFRFEDYICQRIIKANVGREILYTEVSALHPKSRGEILLRSNDPFDAPVIKAGYMSERIDLEDMIDYIEDFTRIENSTFFKSVDAKLLDLKLPHCENLQFKSRDYWRCYVQCMSSSIFHYTSTCPMGTVLDNKLRVRGVRRLRVADASAMPNIVSANPKLAVSAVAEKAADLIKDDY